jgi:hypothetical protein
MHQYIFIKDIASQGIGCGARDLHGDAIGGSKGGAAGSL